MLSKNFEITFSSPTPPELTFPNFRNIKALIDYSLLSKESQIYVSLCRYKWEMFGRAVDGLARHSNREIRFDFRGNSPVLRLWKTLGKDKTVLGTHERVYRLPHIKKYDLPASSTLFMGEVKPLRCILS